ncbi:hypothetical protein F3Y22_tig00110469pilonHSYRG00002 [Hibiscus syriacus]|uniref:EF-hand domain-containing protein n=1 Tax=Hibiscus syriacus TaxID=106335 RepID=A0A6A3AIK6_HIBSY|nr:hypothetical protein F3Y22_tig00110469pilonHSYRG00002 [Hibiscus syriacus]
MNMNDKQTTKLDEDQLAELRDIFQSYDRNKDGGSPNRKGRCKKQWSGGVFGVRYDSSSGANVGGEITYSEEQLKLLFKVFDRDGNGFITAAELAQSMEKLGLSLTVEELTEMIMEADTDGDGKISFEEFSYAITSASLIILRVDEAMH